MRSLIICWVILLLGAALFASPSGKATPGGPSIDVGILIQALPLPVVIQMVLEKWHGWFNPYFHSVLHLTGDDGDQDDQGENEDEDEDEDDDGSPANGGGPGKGARPEDVGGWIFPGGRGGGGG